MSFRCIRLLFNLCTRSISSSVHLHIYISFIFNHKFVFYNFYAEFVQFLHDKTLGASERNEPPNEQRIFRKQDDTHLSYPKEWERVVEAVCACMREEIFQPCFLRAATYRLVFELVGAGNRLDEYLAARSAGTVVISQFFKAVISEVIMLV